MSNELATLPSRDQLPAYLQGAERQVTPFAGGIAESFPLPFLSVRGKEFRFRKNQQEVNTQQRSLSVIMVEARANVSKRYYAKGYSSGSTDAPDCSSRDGVTPDVPEPVAPKCATCPNNQFGSRITENGKQGKACQDYKRLILWVLGLHDEPVVLDVAATSLRAPKGQRGQYLMLRDYVDMLAKHGLDPRMVVTRLQFTDAEYPQLCFTFERLVSEEEWKAVQQMADSEDVTTVIAEDLHSTGVPEASTDAAQPPSQDAAPPAEAQAASEPAPAPQPAPQQAPEQSAAQQTPPNPAPAESAPPPSTSSGDGDVMEKLAALLAKKSG